VAGRADRHQARAPAPADLPRAKSRRRRGDQRKGFTEVDYGRFFDAADQQLAGPLVVIWDNLNSQPFWLAKGGCP